MEDSVFTKIIKGEIPCYKVYEDEHTFVIMDIHPVQPGMVVVLSKRQVENFYGLPDDEYTALWATVKKMAIKMKQIFPAKKRIIAAAEGLDVSHVHVQMFPADNGDELRAMPNLNPDVAVLAEMAKKLAL